MSDDYFIKIQEMHSNTGTDPAPDDPNYPGTFPPFGGINDTNSRVWYRFEFNIFKYNNGTWDLHARKYVYYARLFNIKNARNWSINTGDIPIT